MGEQVDLVPDTSAAAASGTITTEGRAVAALPRAQDRQAQAFGFSHIIFNRQGGDSQVPKGTRTVASVQKHSPQPLERATPATCSTQKRIFQAVPHLSSTFLRTRFTFTIKTFNIPLQSAPSSHPELVVKPANHLVPWNQCLQSTDYLVQNPLIKRRPKGHVGARGVRLVNVHVRVWGLDDELLRAEERPEVGVKVLLLQARLAAGGRPEVHGAGGDADEHQAGGAGGDEGQGGENDPARLSDTEGAPPGEEPPQAALECGTKRVAAGGLTWRRRGGLEGPSHS